MGKKRKAPGQPFGKNVPAVASDLQSKLGPINSWEDVADSEDEFILKRDKIQLEDGPAEKRRKKWKAEDEDFELSDQEVLGSSDSSEDAEDEDDEGETDREDGYSKMPLSTEGLENFSESEASGNRTHSNHEGGWGSSKQDYYGNDAIETEADALEEEAEACRLQQRRLAKMKDADFGFDEGDWVGTANQETKTDGLSEESIGDTLTEVLPPIEIAETMSADERMAILHDRYPEFEALRQDFLQLIPLHTVLRGAAADAMASFYSEQSSKSSVSRNPPAIIIKFRALTSYLGTLSMYFALLSSTGKGGTALAMDPTELHEHPIMESLYKIKEIWSQVKDLQILVDKNAINENSPPQPVKFNENLETLQEATLAKPAVSLKRPKITKRQRKEQAAKAAADAERAEKIRKKEEELAELSLLLQPDNMKLSAGIRADLKNPDASIEGDSDFGDEDYLSEEDAAEKATKKKSLRFYTSQIAQKSNKRQRAGNDAGGDADLPYKERLRDRQARLLAEAEKRGKHGRKGDQRTSLDGESDEEDRKLAKENRKKDHNSDEEYYDLVAATSKKRKLDKEQKHTAIVAAADGERLIRASDPSMPEDGKRAIGYTIEKNKGLAPTRKKDVRNPRVKKRKKYEEKKKKLSSIRQVFKGGEGKGGYGGELTGIKTGLVRGVKL
ncbi:MAG: hypothetical protein M1829_004035 [Trizodia sp. TS-e1964]|nr:MAG: hypothetical protein M1829_004035 [Trizodia sp. TS-e1964]